MHAEVPDTIRTKVVGVTMGPEDSSGPVRQGYIKQLRDKDIRGIKLIREPGNIYDKYAIAVYSDAGDGPIQLGYISNNVKICPTSKRECDKVGRERLCPQCGLAPERQGLAKRLAEFMDVGIKYQGIIEHFTGGGEENPSLGVNIRIDRVL